MSTITRASAGFFDWKVSKSLPGSPTPYIAKKRKTPSPGGHLVSYYKGSEEADDDFEVDEETIVVDHDHYKKRKVDSPEDNGEVPSSKVTTEVIIIDDDSDEDIPLAKLNVTQRSKQLQQPQPDVNSGKLFRDFPLEVCPLLSPLCPLKWAQSQILTDIGSNHLHHKSPSHVEQQLYAPR